MCITIKMLCLVKQHYAFFLYFDPRLPFSSPFRYHGIHSVLSLNWDSTISGVQRMVQRCENIDLAAAPWVKRPC